MKLFSLVVLFLFGGYGIFSLMSSYELGMLTTLLAALAWCGLFLFVFLSTHTDDRDSSEAGRRGSGWRQSRWH